MLNKSTIRNLFLAASATLVMGCVAVQPVAKTVTQPAVTQSAVAADAVALLRKASYPLGDPFGTVTLVDGKFEGKAAAGSSSSPTAGLLAELVTSGDLNGDGQPEAVAPLWTNGGGSGTFSYLAVMALTPDKATAVAVTELGDRVQVKKVAVADGKIVLTMVHPGKDEPLCCGTETVEQQYTLDGNTLKQAASKVLIPVVAERLANATYTIPMADDKPAAVQLKQGQWEGQPDQAGGASHPIVRLATQPGTQAAISGLGDLNGDGADEVLTVVTSEFGGSGVFSHLVVMSQGADGSLSQLATTPLEDRAQVEGLGVQEGKIVLTLVHPGKDEPLCCGTETVEQQYTLDGSSLKQAASKVLIPVLAERLANATYTIPMADDKPAAVQLKQGQWEGQPDQAGGASRPLVGLATLTDTHAIISAMGDLNGDGAAEVMTVLTSTFGGSGVIPHLVVMAQGADGSLSQLATTPLEDRAQVQSIGVEEGKVQVQALTHSATDPSCCPSQATQLTFTLQDGKLTLVK